MCKIVVLPYGIRLLVQFIGFVGMDMGSVDFKIFKLARVQSIWCAHDGSPLFSDLNSHNNIKYISRLKV